MEPCRLRRWRLPSSSVSAVFYTCARPGRSRGSKGKVPDKLLHDWMRGIPSESNVVVVSLLGEKKDGTSEFSFYSFYAKGRTFQQWLDQNYAERAVQVIEHPTVDFCRVPTETLEAAASDIAKLLSEGRTVVLMDSGGEQRSGQVCTHMGAVEDSRG